MVVAIDDIRNFRSANDPIQCSDLKRHKPLDIIFITIDVFSIEQFRNCYQIQFESQLIRTFLKNVEREIKIPQFHIIRINTIPLIFFYEGGFITRKHHPNSMIRVILILWQSSYNIGQTAHFCHRITLRSDMKYFHLRISFFSNCYIIRPFMMD